MKVPLITALAAALMMSTAALGAPRETLSAPKVAPPHDSRATFIMKRAAEIMPIRPLKLNLLTNDGDGRQMYMLTFDLSRVPGAPRVISSGVATYPGASNAEIDRILQTIAAELQKILDNVAAGRQWNSGVTPHQTISSSF